VGTGRTRGIASTGPLLPGLLLADAVRRPLPMVGVLAVRPTDHDPTARASSDAALVALVRLADGGCAVRPLGVTVTYVGMPLPEAPGWPVNFALWPGGPFPIYYHFPSAGSEERWLAALRSICRKHE
jgi:hypothetical protein